MLPSQRHLFDIPRDVAYLNAAAWSPLPLAVQEAGRRGVARKGRPWELGGRAPRRGAQGAALGARPRPRPAGSTPASARSRSSAAARPPPR